MRIRNEAASKEETDERTCIDLCFLNVSDDIYEELETCSIENGRSFWNDQQPHKRIMNDVSVYECN